MREWQDAHVELARCCSICWRMVSNSPFFACASRAGTSGGGGGGGVPNKFSRTHLPRCTTEVRLGYDVTVRILPCANKPPRFTSARATRRNCDPYTLGMP